MELKRDRDGVTPTPRCGGGLKRPSDDQVNHKQSKLNHLYDSASIVSSHVTRLKNLFGNSSRSWTIVSRDAANRTISNIEDTLREIREEVKEIVVER